MIRPQYQQVSKHLQRVRDHVQLAACNFVPFDRDLFYWDVKHLGEEQNLDIEDPRRQVLTGEDLLGSSSCEKLEPALGVADVANTEHTEDCVEAVH